MTERQTTIIAVCSNQARASTGSAGRRHVSGSSLWGRDLFHAAGAGSKTLCGRLCGDWLTIGLKPTDEALADSNFCRRCAAQVTKGNAP